MENLQNENKVADALIDWSKWLIGINFFAVTGCTIVLENLKVNKIEAVGPYLFGAIISFATSILVSVVITYMLAIRPRAIKLKPFHFILCTSQIIVFAVGLIFLVLWIQMKIYPG